MTSDPSVFLLCNSSKSSLVGRLNNAARLMGIRFGCGMYRDIRIMTRDRLLSIDIGSGSEDLTSHSHYMFTGAIGTHHAKNALITAVQNQAVVLNKSALEQNIGGMNKLVQLVRLAKAGVPIIPTTQANESDGIAAAIAERHDRGVAAFIKPISGTGGAGCRVVSPNETNEVEVNPRQTLVQDYLPIAHDYRVLILDNRILGVMKREIGKGEVVSNVAKGSVTSAAEVGEDALNAAQLATQTMGLEFAGVDVMVHDNKPYVIEVNSNPNFSGFEDATGVNVAKELLTYLISKPVPKTFDPATWMPRI